MRDAAGAVVFESGALRPDGAIAGNDNDEHPDRFEPHHLVIDSPDDVQIYEVILAGADGKPTTGLTSAVGHLKENRLPPDGFDKHRVPEDIAVTGAALEDPDFEGGADRVRYRTRVAGARGPFRIDALLWYQPISFRWAQNLGPYDAPEPRRFLSYFDAMAAHSAIVLARAAATVP